MNRPRAAEAPVPLFPSLQRELGLVDENLREVSDSAPLPVQPILEHALGAPGKRMRPAIAIAASQVCPGPAEAPVLVATGVELLHIATLVHDDTVDDTPLRRGRSTVAREWGAPMAVLAGDYIFAAAARYVCRTGNLRVVERFTQTIMDLSSGELIERFTAYDWRQTRQQYEERIYQKTASLFSASAEVGALLSDASQEGVAALTLYGRSVGMAFQVVDDILDFQGTADEVGKPVGQDLAQGTLTLPAIIALERYPKDNPIVALFTGEAEEENQRRALELVRNSGAIEEAYAAAAAFCRQATDALAPLPESAAKRLLVETADGHRFKLGTGCWSRRRSTLWSASGRGGRAAFRTHPPWDFFRGGCAPHTPAAESLR